MSKALPIENADALVHVIRGQRVMLDSDLAGFYGVATKRLLEQVRRNIHRFPDDFAFQLEAEEVAALRSQIATSNIGRGGRRTRPWAFTEHGAVMLASVLNSAVAIAASVEIVRAFVRMRDALSASDLVAKLVDIEKRIGVHDRDIAMLFGALRQLLESPKTGQGEIGFHTLREDETTSDTTLPPRRTVRYTAKRRTRMTRKLS
jgi:ORF6N domain